MAEWLRRLTRNQMGSPSQVRILQLSSFNSHFAILFFYFLLFSFPSPNSAVFFVFSLSILHFPQYLLYKSKGSLNSPREGPPAHIVFSLLLCRGFTRPCYCFHFAFVVGKMSNSSLWRSHPSSLCITYDAIVFTP